jgi:hypothetical protein
VKKEEKSNLATNGEINQLAKRLRIRALRGLLEAESKPDTSGHWLADGVGECLRLLKLANELTGLIAVEEME